MSIPILPGYTAPRRSLDAIWNKPDGDWPESLWPRETLREIAPNPTDWVVVAQQRVGGGSTDAAVSSVLIDPKDIPRALVDDAWTGTDAGSAAIMSSAGREWFEEGLIVDDFGISAGFFCQGRSHHGLTRPSVEIHLPFLWYWDAIPRGEDWYYLNQAGRDQDLVRVHRDGDSYRVEVRALPLRRYLSRLGKVLLVQYDAHRHADVDDIPRLDCEYRAEWCYFTWYCDSSPDSFSQLRSFSRLMGKYVIQPVTNIPGPRMEERRGDKVFPEFIVGVDPETGDALRHTCDPNQLGTYFDREKTRLHYLTPVYFDAGVLARYTSEPRRYRVTRNRLSCLDLWGIQIGHGTSGLIEAYLGDLGRDLPSDEWQHWLAHNVLPSGQMSEDRFRRDFLNQWVSSPDLVADLRRAHASANAASERALGAPLWRTLDEPARTQYEHLHPPVSSDPLALESPVLTLCKALVDAINVTALRNYLGEEDKSIPSLSLLDRVVESAGGDKEILVRPLRNLYALRSQGGIAHLPGSGRQKLLERLKLEDADAVQVFEAVCGQTCAALNGLQEAFVALGAKPTEVQEEGAVS